MENMKHSGRLIILHYTKIGEKSLVLHCLTGDWGRRSFVCTVKRGGSMAILLPLSIVDAEISENPKSELWRAGSMSAAYPLSNIRTNPYKNAISLFMSEVLYRAVHEGDFEPGLFEWCEKSILTLDSLPSDCSNFHLRWLLELCGAMGFSPDAIELAPFAGEYYARIKDLVSLSFAECMLLPMSGRERCAIVGILLQYLSYHIESAINVKSLGVLQELFK